MGLKTVAALYVEKGGCYFGLENVEPWDKRRDARKYDGPWPVVAHPPCNTWCRLAPLNQSLGVYRVGDDGGAFAHALACVKRLGGVLEHPAYTYAWKRHNLPKPHKGGWFKSFFDEGWVCEVEQGHYGHAASKATWLYAVGCELPSMPWGLSDKEGKISSFRLSDERKRVRGSKASATPLAFRDTLIEMARSVA